MEPVSHVPSTLSPATDPLAESVETRPGILHQVDWAASLHQSPFGHHEDSIIPNDGAQAMS